jgi:hypothetical protein
LTACVNAEYFSEGAHLEHLRGANHRLADHITLRDDHLLRQKYFVCGNLDPEVPSCYHDTVACLQDLVEIVTAFLVLDLRKDLVGDNGGEKYASQRLFESFS